MPGTINIALMAHVDAGKTTLTERILYETHIIRAPGSVDAGTARTDDLEVERRRGISVRAAFTSFMAGDMTVNLIDTPGHADFYSQTERAFLAVDAVVVLVSAVDGVQPGTEHIIERARERGVPVIFFINKCDREAARKDDAALQIKAAHAGAFDYVQERLETAAAYDDALLQAFLDGEDGDDGAIAAVIAERTGACAVAPMLSGSAYTGEGVGALLRCVCDVVLPDVPGQSTDGLSGVIFSVTHDKAYGRGAYIRLYSGTLAVRDVVCVRGVNYKISMIKRQQGGRWGDVRTFGSGETALVYGLSDCRTGEAIGDSSLLPPRAAQGLSAAALLMIQIRPETEAGNTALKAALETMAAEDPLLELKWEPVSKSMHINVMGVIQTEVLCALIEERFGIKALTGPPMVIYKETLTQPSIGYDAYTMPKPSWAILKFQLTPSGRGSGVTYRCSAPPARIPYRYRAQIEQSVTPSLRQGVYGWEVTDVDIELVDGEDHPIHTHPLDFSIATPLALMDGLRRGAPVLLEPILDMRFTFDRKHLGRVTSDVAKMRGEAEAPVYQGENIILRAKVPLAPALDYAVTFAAVTSGYGVMTQRLHGYRECPLELGKTCPRRGVDPSDRSKYILAARHALAGTVYEG